MTDWPPWAPLGAVILHVLEEFVCPGGFVAWYRRYRADASRITTRFLVIINAALLIACWDIAILGRRGAGVPYWLTIAAPNLLKRMLACVGQLQVSRILSWSNYWNRDLYPFSNLRLHPFSALRRSFNDDCVDHSHYRWFVSVLVCTFSSRAAAVAFVANGSE
jgi:hypothetical protein